MSLPKCLNMALGRFQKATQEKIRIFPQNKNTFSNGEVISFRLPSTGCIDVDSLTLLVPVVATAGASAAASSGSNPKQYIAQAFSRVEVLMGGQLVGLAGSANEFSMIWTLLKQLAEPNYLDSGSNNVYEYQILGAAATGSVTTNYMINDFRLGFMQPKSMRMIPLAAFPEIEIRITLALDRLFAPANQTLTVGSASAGPPTLYATKYSWEDNLVESLVAARLQQSPLEISFLNATVFTSGTFQNTIQFPFQIAAQSVDYIIAYTKSSTIATNSGFYHMTSASAPAGSAGIPSSATFQLLLNASPVSWPLSVPECWVYLTDAMDMAGGNILGDVKVTSTAAWDGSGGPLSFTAPHRFMFVHRTCLPDSDRQLTGMNTYGSNVPMVVNITNAGADRVAQVVVLHTSTLELSAGRQINVVN